MKPSLRGFKPLLIISILSMSNQQPPEPPPTPRGSKTPEKGQGSSGGTNWRVIILMGIALGILVLAWKSSGFGKPKRLTYSEFRDYVDSGKIIDEQELPKRGEGFPDIRHKLKKSGESFAVYTLSGFYYKDCLLYTSPSPRDRQKSRMPSSA